MNTNLSFQGSLEYPRLETNFGYLGLARMMIPGEKLDQPEL